MAHYLIMLCSSLTRSHCLFISIHPRLPHIAVIAVVAATLLSPSPLPLPPHKLSPLQPPPLPPSLPPSPLRRLLPLPSSVGCCILGSDLSGFFHGCPCHCHFRFRVRLLTVSLVSSNGTFLGGNRVKTNIMCGGRRRRVAAAAAGGCTQ